MNFIRWDAHGCPPQKVGGDLSCLSRYKQSGLNFVSLNVGFDLSTQAETMALIDYMHQWISEHQNEFMLVQHAEQIVDCQLNNILGVAFDIEGCNILNNQIEMIPKLYEMGVRQILFAYNNNNACGGGCFDIDTGLTQFGKQLVKACNEVGMVIDCSHVGYRTSMEIMALSHYPIVFSHSNPAALTKHPRNILDEQIMTCAEVGGVIGINGVGIFLGNNDIRSAKIVEHIDYVVQKIGPKHVGIGLDCMFDEIEASHYAEKYPHIFPKEYGFDDVAVAQPEQFMEIEQLLEQRGYDQNAIVDIMGKNFFRIAQTVWK